MGENHMRMEMRHRIAERREQPALAVLDEIESFLNRVDAAGEFARFHGGEARAHLAHRRHLDAVRPPALAIGEAPRQPVGQRACGRHADALALEVIDGLDRPVLHHDERHVARLARHGGDGDGRHALGRIAHARARAEADVDRAGGERLLQLAIASENGNLGINAEGGEDALFLGHIGAGEGEGRANRLADAQLRGGKRRHGLQGETGYGGEGQRMAARDHGAFLPCLGGLLVDVASATRVSARAPGGNGLAGLFEVSLEAMSLE